MIKDFNELIWDVSEAEYRADKAISYSTLSKYAKEGFKGLKELLQGAKVSSAALRHGSVVDTLLTDYENFDSLYLVSNYVKPTETIREIVDSVWEEAYKDGLEGNLASIGEEYPDYMLNIINSHNYGADNWRPATKINKIVDGGADYYNQLILASEGKTLLHQEEYDYAMACVREITTNKFTSFLFKEKEGTKLYYQSKFKISFVDFNTPIHPFEWEEEIIEKNTIRCMYDMIYVDYNNKTILPIDLKTTGWVEEDFENSLYKWRYDLQATKYSYILRQVVAQDDYFKDFKILPFAFLPINKFHLNPQFYVYEKSLNDVQEAFIKNGEVFLPWHELLNRVRWHIETDNFRYYPETVKNNGINYIK